ncbi:MAG: prolyl hydroxylase family protein [Gammaproteobacteria bacterium]
MKLLRRIRRRLSKLLYRRNYYLSKLVSFPVPAAPIYHLPEGFSINVVGETGLRIVDNFCTAEEADYLIDLAKKQLGKSQVIVKGKPVFDPGRTSSHAVVFHRRHQDRKILPLIARGAMLAGVPVDHAEQIYVSRYSEGELYHGHYDIATDFLTSHRLCTMLIYLNTLEEHQGGATYFRDLNVAVKPTLGRAVIWTNMNPDGTPHKETLHAALPPVGEGVEKWVIQLWFRPYRMFPTHFSLNALQVIPGRALVSSEALPEGVWLPSERAS